MEKSIFSHEDSLCYCTTLRKASRRLTGLYDDVMAPAGLKSTQIAVLSHIRRLGSASVNALADSLVMDASGLTHTLKPLERDGFIRIQIDAKDRRGKLISLTPTGEKKLKETDLLWTRAQLTFEKLVGESAPELRESLKSLLTKEFANKFADTL